MFFEETLVFNDETDANEFENKLIAEGNSATVVVRSAFEYEEEVLGRIRDLRLFFSDEMKDIDSDDAFSSGLFNSYRSMFNNLDYLCEDIPEFLNAHDGVAVDEDPDHRRYLDLMTKKGDYADGHLSDDDVYFRSYYEIMMDVMCDNNMIDHVYDENGQKKAIMRKSDLPVDDLTVSVKVPAFMSNVLIGPKMSTKNRKAYNIKTSVHVSSRLTYDVTIPMKYILTADHGKFESMTGGYDIDQVSYSSVKANMIAKKNLADTIIRILKQEGEKTLDEIFDDLLDQLSASMTGFLGTDKVTFIAPEIDAFEEALYEMANHGFIRVKDEDDEEIFYV